jgi:hypothetical protein
MGTRNLTMVQLDGKVVISQYCQWDGYPSGQGASLLGYLTEYKDIMDTVKEHLRTVKHITEQELLQLWKDAGADDSGFVSMAISDKFKDMHPQLERSCGADILKYVRHNKNLPVSIDDSFMYDSLFCEWAYYVDLDNNVLEVYEGFNKTPLVEGVDRFYKADISGEYKPVKLIKTYSLNDLPSEDVFVDECQKASRSYTEQDEE